MTKEGQPPGQGDEQAPIELTAEQAAMFVKALNLAMRKRRIMLLGYFATLLALVLGQIAALIVWANRTPGTFVGWMFLIPLALAGACLWGFGRWAKAIKPKP
jgi:hypothetical protein